MVVARIWAISGGGHLVAIRRQSGTDTGSGLHRGGSEFDHRHLLTPIPDSVLGEPAAATREPTEPPSREYNVGVGAWDISPGDVPSAESLLGFGTAIAARRPPLISERGTEAGDHLGG